MFLVVFIDVERVMTTLVRTGSTNRAVQVVLERERGRTFSGHLAEIL